MPVSRISARYPAKNQAGVAKAWNDDAAAAGVLAAETSIVTGWVWELQLIQIMKTMSSRNRDIMLHAQVNPIYIGTSIHRDATPLILHPI